MTDSIKEFSAELGVIFEYMEGNLSLDEAAKQLQGPDLCYREVRDFLMTQPRFNIVHLEDHKSVT
tara:strand:+ start:1431 stop:1625 length:195 start_codon:yes stop_codon:yes gene_type:complete